MVYYFTVLQQFALFSSVAALTTVDLNGQWTVSNANSGISVPGTVPGSMYMALMASGKIGEPYFRKNDEEYQWIGEEDWTYNRTFTVTSELLAYPAVVLVCEGLDTVATVLVNNVQVGTSDNMFVRYIYDIKSALVEGDNTITVEFRSATRYVQELSSSLPYPILPECVTSEYHGPCRVNLIRKMQYSFNLDWGPPFPEQAIWQDIYIQGYSTAVVRDVTASTTIGTGGTWQLDVDVFMEVQGDDSVQGEVAVTLVDTSVSSTMSVTLTPDNSTVSFNISIPKSVAISEWWPNGYGNQTLYNLTVVYTDSMGTVDARNIRVGFRTVELVQDYVSANKTLGRTFYFKINGLPIFLKGSNWAPADSLLERVSRDRVNNYLKSAADVHMNAIRVWGGGIYEFDMFYEIADELGIMIWQDFMFACSMYPTHDAFLKSVKEEVKYQVRRLKHHPSIIVLSGNNENEKALVQDWYGTDINYTRYKDDYLKLYIDTIRSVVLEEDTSRPFVSSSPSNGIQTEMEGWVAKQPWSTHYGDIHEYNYLAPFYDPHPFRVPRFSSEYGLQSFPSLESLEPVYNESDMDYWSDLNDYRNHYPFGNILMMAEAIQYLKIPNCPDRRQRFDDLIYVTQIDHAIGMKTMTENYRRWQNRLDSEGQGNTMGALYWMLEDMWQAPSWASIEYGGKWKMLHYFAGHFFTPTLISPYLDGSDLDVYIVLDELPSKEVRHPVDHTLHFRPKSNPRPFSFFDLSTWGEQPVPKDVETNMIGEPAMDDFSGNLYIEMYSWDNMVSLKSWKVPFTVNSTAESVFRRNVDEMVSEAGCTRRATCVLSFHFGDPEMVPSNWLPLTVFNRAEGLNKANIQIADVNATDVENEYLLNVTTDNIAPFVWLEATGVQGRFSDNGFLMLTQNKTLTFYAWEMTSVQELTAALKVKSLQDVYY